MALTVNIMSLIICCGMFFIVANGCCAQGYCTKVDKLALAIDAACVLLNILINLLMRNWI